LRQPLFFDEKDDLCTLQPDFAKLHTLNISLTTGYSFWMVLLCVLAGTGYAAVLYYRNPLHDSTLRMLWFLVVLRFLSISIITFLLLSPMLRILSQRTEKPIVILANDQSQSIVAGADSAFYRKVFVKELDKLAIELGKKFDIKRYGYGDKLTNYFDDKYNGKQTDMAELFSEIGTRYANRNLAALVFTGDGIYNTGLDPLYAAENVSYPLYTIALGDTNVQRDVVLAHLQYNSVAYLGDDFPLDIVVNAFKSNGLSTTLTVTDGKENVFYKDISITSDIFTQTVPLRLNASQSGSQHFRISLTAVNNEISRVNNAADIFIDVLDGRQKVLIVASAPHPDISALRQAIGNNRNYEVTDRLTDNLNESLRQFSLIILHQVPSVTDASSKLLQDIRTAGIPVFYILGAQSALPLINGLKTGVSIASGNGSTNEALPVAAPGFALFTLSDDMRRALQEFPPLLSPFGQYRLATSATPMLYQRIGSVTTDMPLLLFNQGAEVKSAVLTGEGIWHWRMSDFERNGNHQLFDEMIRKIVQYLSVKLDKSLFRIIMKNYYSENEVVEANAEVYNESYELVNDADVSLDIVDENGKKFPYTFGRTTTDYHLVLGSFPPGVYKYTANLTYGGKSYTRKGEFVVTALNIESAVTVANHHLLFNLASRHGGTMLYPKNMQSIKDLLEKRDDIKTVVFSELRYTDLINLFWVFLVIVVLLATEWLLRKRAGGY